MSPIPSPKKRLAIVGGGMGGIATAWFCDAEWDVSLFEARDRLGGNCDSATIEDREGDVVADLGAQFFHPETHPTYFALLELLEPLEQGRSERRLRYEITASLAVVPLGGGDPYFTSAGLVRTPLHAVEFLVYARAARKMAFGGDYDVTVADWVGDLPVRQRFKTQILLPWLTASEGHSLEETKRSSARAVLQLFAPSHPRRPLQQATTWSSKAGLQGHLRALADDCRGASFHTGSPVVRVEKEHASWFVVTKARRAGPFDAVAINAPPWESKKLLGHLPWAEELVGILERFEFVSHQLTIHADPTYMHRERRHWGLANVGIEAGERGDNSELSIWMGAALDRRNGKPVDLFKSWTTYRSQAPKRVLFARTFQHAIKTPTMMRAARKLGAWQGRHGLWFAGHFTSGIDLQEWALRSAMDLSSALCASSPNLAALERRVRSRTPAARSGASLR
jgi:uncharacterized protein